EGPAVYGRRAAPAPVVRDRPRAIEVRVQARDEQQVVVPRPVRIAPGLVDKIDLGVARQEPGEQGPDPGLHRQPVLAAAAMVVDVARDDPDLHDAAGSFRPSLPTATTAWVRLLTPSALSIAVTWIFTVPSASASSRQMILFGLPCTMSASTCAWRCVRPMSR